MEMNGRNVAVPFEIMDDWVPDIAKVLAGYCPEDLFGQHPEDKFEVPIKLISVVESLIEEHRQANQTPRCDETDAVHCESFDLNEFASTVENLKSILEEGVYGSSEKSRLFPVLQELNFILKSHWRSAWGYIHATNYVLMLSSIAAKLAEADLEYRKE
ncbi:MAG: hypothetical protein KDB68_02050 [Planctomycetes bacterium]|nr:hypothetical protein [Planctomycetota bacterium]